MMVGAGSRNRDNSNNTGARIAVYHASAVERPMPEPAVSGKFAWVPDRDRPTCRFGDVAPVRSPPQSVRSSWTSSNLAISDDQGDLCRRDRRQEPSKPTLLRRGPPVRVGACLRDSLRPCRTTG
ncbi:hypothetical protein A8926_7692 [Saccharopolyspora spinosa]|uniref:Uncharacterized protein n=1 Tax=Saccharopolyspora spinosa TaxID=60894 RepID=A0A2N3Y9D4_SACSN|nr:hypothetical protein A8926_7692 [Saccharopolyspora spinosa]